MTLLPIESTSKIAPENPSKRLFVEPPFPSKYAADPGPSLRVSGRTLRELSFAFADALWEEFFIRWLGPDEPITEFLWRKLDLESDLERDRERERGGARELECEQPAVPAGRVVLGRRGRAEAYIVLQGISAAGGDGHRAVVGWH